MPRASQTHCIRGLRCPFSDWHSRRWNVYRICRKKDFKAEQLDLAAYKDFKVVETRAFKRNMFFVPRKEKNIFNPAFNDCEGIDAAIEELAAFHEAKEIMIDSAPSPC